MRCHGRRSTNKASLSEMLPMPFNMVAKNAPHSDVPVFGYAQDWSASVYMVAAIGASKS